MSESGSATQPAGNGERGSHEPHKLPKNTFRGIRMDKNERKPLFTIIDRMEDSSEPLWVEYLRGYHRGIEAQVFGVSDEWIEEHSLLVSFSGGGSGDPYIDSYARGYHDGFEGIAPESPLSSKSSESSKSLLIASIV
jgi:hypothetical protein